MSEVSLDALNARFAINNHVSFKAGPGGLPVADVRNDHASGTVALLGGQVLAFQPQGHGPVLWVSKRSHFEVGRPVRGGIPVCWPWFGAHPEDPGKPFHGFARTAVWSVIGTRAVGGATQIRLGTSDNEQTRALWPHSFQLAIVVTIGPELRVELVARNAGQEGWTCTDALHSYFSVSDVTAITIHGLDGCYYFEGTAERVLQRTPVKIASEVDRVYFDTSATCTIEDPGLGREIRVAKDGSRSTVVWNPWVEKAERMEDFGDEEYRRMVCVETANTRYDPARVPAGGEHHLSAMISVERI